MRVSAIVISIFFISILAFCGFRTNSFTAIQQKQNAQLKDKGVGPIKELKVGAIDKKLVAKGSEIFEAKCSACHDVDDVNLAPAVRGVTKILSPEFIMNYLMNTAEMQKNDPYVKKLIQNWKTVPIMKDQKLKEKDARAVVEFLRSVE